jgi:serine/threonine protein kinase
MGVSASNMFRFFWAKFFQQLPRQTAILYLTSVRSPYRAPEWVTDPFISAGVAVDLPERNRLLNGRYLLVYTLDESARGSVHLGADLIGGRKCLIKRAARDAQVGDGGRDACDLRRETEVLRRLAGTLPVPSAFDLIEDGGDLILVMEDLEGETLSEYIERRASYGCLLSTAEVVALGRELAALLGAIHSRGVIYRDLKSTNVIVATNSRLRLIDFELAYEPSRPDPPEGRGTEGYMSPQASAGAVPTVLDDIFGVGAILYFLATAAEPSLGPAGCELTRRPIGLLNPHIHDGLAAVISRCLAEDPMSRFPSMAALDAALESSLIPIASETIDLDEKQGSDVSHRSRMFSIRLGDSLCAAAVRDPSGGIFWASTYDAESGLERRDLSGGSAGVLLALAELVAEFDNPGHRQALSEGTLWLARSKPWGAPLPGLYVGESGIAAALLRAGQVLNSGEFVEMAAQRGRAIAALPHASPDLYHGSAGRLRLHLFLWNEMQEADHLTHAIEAGEAVLRAGETLPDGRMRWTIPPGYEGLSGDTYLGYAHGAAGIGDSLLDLYLASGDERFLLAAQCAARWLVGRAVEVFRNGLDWPAIDSDRVPAGAFWCHGAGGIGRFFLNLSVAGAFGEAYAMAERAAHTVSMAARRVGPTQCHGLAGNIEFMLDMFQATGNRSFLSHARTLARILEAFALERNGSLVWTSDSSRIITTDYMVGFAGVAACLLRLASPDDRPHQLSVRGFRWGRQPREGLTSA